MLFRRNRRFHLAALLACALLALARPAEAQEHVRLSGLAYLDAYYQIASPEAEAEGRHGFTARRLYLTADFRLSDAFSGRARLEANDASLNNAGLTPFVKDLYLTWNAGRGHALTFGIAPSPVFEIAEEVWGYRALEKTLLDRNGVASSRDFGLRADGPITPGGALSYAVMVGNNEGVLPEDDDFRRVYAQLALRPSEAFVVTLGGNVAGFEDAPERRYVVNGLIGYAGEAWRAGVEGFLGIDDFDGRQARAGGVSAFGAVRLAERWALVARANRVEAQARSALTEPSTLGLFGIDYRPHPQVHLLPSVEVVKLDAEDRAAALARATLWFSF